MWNYRASVKVVNPDEGYTIHRLEGSFKTDNGTIAEAMQSFEQVLTNLPQEICQVKLTLEWDY